MPSQDATARLNAALEGRYRIERELGQGGMATVYLASDLRHERQVALKVLKPELAAVVGAERFLAEIKTTANLQHPHILPLFDSGEADSFLFYVMPFVEGESLRERLDREQQLPVNEATRIATNVAEGLGYAHRRGVIHRDIKPANVLLLDGQPVISDFGIALAVRAGGGDRLTETGLSVGTPHYMSPEQATGDQIVGPASDVYALGCVLYEMLVGEPPYTGSNAQAILGKIIQGQATRVTDIRKSTPPNVAATVARSLEKLPADRFPTAEEFARALEDSGFRWGEPVGAFGSGSGGGFWKSLALGLGVVAAASIGGLGLALSRPDPPRAVQRFVSPFARGQEPVRSSPGAFDLSPDGSMMIYEGRSEEGEDQLWMHRWEAWESAPVPSSVGACCVTISPDGGGVVFERGRDLIAVGFDGGPPRNLGEGASPLWGWDGFVYFLRDDDLLRLPASGGSPQLISEADPGGFLVPQSLLPGGEAVLVLRRRSNDIAEALVVDVSTGASTALFESEAEVRYLATGHVLYVMDGVLTAMPFDAAARELRGSPVPLIEDVRAFTVADDGTLLYTTGSAGIRVPNTELVWLSRTGAAQPVDSGWTFDRGIGNWGWVLSPDGARIALRDEDAEGNQDIWVKDLRRGARGPLIRITTDPRQDWVPAWSWDSEDVMYLSGDPQDVELWRASPDGTGAPELLFRAPGIAQYAVSPDGTQFVLRYGAFGASGARDLLAFQPGVDSAPVPLIATADFQEQGPAFSPDGRWLAYVSNETGEDEVYVASFPEVASQKTRVSTRGGSAPIWAHGGEDLYYIDAERNLVAAAYRTEPRFEIAGETILFALPEDILIADPGANAFSVTPDDQLFLMGREVAPEGDAAESEYVVVLNFSEEVRRRVPVP